jgi:plastocyanin
LKLHPFRRYALLATAAIAAPLALAACGSDDDEGDGGEEPAALEISIAEGKEGAGEFTLPDSIEAGVSEITVSNDGKAPHSAQLIRVEGEHDEQEVLEALGAAQEGEPFEDWFYAGGGTGEVPPGESATVTQALEPDSTYWVVDDTADKPEPVELGTTGSESGDGEVEETENVVSASEYEFTAEGLTSGETVTFENAGGQPHHMIGFPIVGDATIEDVETFLKTEKGKPPVDFEAQRGTAVVEGGDTQVSAVELDPGRYALVCFITDRDGGPPHVELGMIDEVEVE